MGIEMKRPESRRRKWLRKSGAIAIALFLAVMFGGWIPAQASRKATPTPNGTPISGTPVAAEPEITWARAIDPATNEPKESASGFVTTDETIYAVLAVARIDQDSVVEATWSYNGAEVPELTATVTVDRGYTDGWIEFHLDRAPAEIWPIGEYAIKITINGQTVAESSVVVTVPPS